MTFSNELKVGLAVIAAIVVFIFGFRFFQNLPLFGSAYELETSFANAQGLTQGNPVHINGVQVGEVKDLRLAPEEGAVYVRFGIDSRYTVPEGSRTSVTGFSALSTVQLAINLGPQGNPPVEAGGFVPSTQTASGEMMSMISDRGPTLLSRADTALVAASSALQSADRLLSNPESDLQQTLAALRGTAASLNAVLAQEEQRIRATIRNFSAASEDLSAFTDSTLTPAASDSLRRAIAQLTRTLDGLDRNMAALESTTARLDAIVTKVDRGEGTLGRLVNDDALYVKLDSAATSMNEVLRDLKRNPRRYLKDMGLIEIF